MKKSLILVGMLAIGYANAQEGVVGINTSEPKATLQVTPSAENAKATATTNEGIMAPQLSKSRVAGIATPVEGTLVYITDETTSPISAYTGADAKVAKITEKGYYYYNGTEWVKAAGANGNIYTTNGTITEDRTITFEQNGRLNLLGTANIGKNAEALGIVGQDHTYFGFYPQGLNEGRKAFMGFPTTGNKNLTIANENEGGKIILKNATQVGDNAEALGIVGQDHTYFGFYPQGLNEGRKAFMGFPTTGNKNLTIANENEGGKIILKNATQVGDNAEALGIVGQDHTYFGFYPQGLNEGRKAFMGFPTTGNKNLTIANENEGGKIILKNATQVGDNAEALGIVGQDHTYVGFYPQGLNSGRKAFMGFPTTGNKNLTIANENEGGKIILKNATQVGDNAEALGIVGQDHTYVGFYPQGLNSGRKAFMGFPTTGNKNLTIANENEGGKILLKNATQVTGDLTASSLSGTGDRPVVAAADGTLKIGSAGQTGVVSASRGLIYDANKKDIALPPGTSTDQVLKWDGTKWVAYTMPSNDISIAKPADYDYKVGDVISQPVECSEKNLGWIVANYFTGQLYKCIDNRDGVMYTGFRWSYLNDTGTVWTMGPRPHSVLEIGYEERGYGAKHCTSWHNTTLGAPTRILSPVDQPTPCLGIRIK